MIESVYTYNLNVDDIFENIVNKEDFKLNHVIIPPNKVFPKHPTDAHVTIIIIEGYLTIQLGEQEEHIYSKGNVIEVPKGIDSLLSNKSNKATELFVIKRN